MRQRLPADPRVYDRATPGFGHPLLSALFLVLLLLAIVVAVSYPMLTVGAAIGLLVRPAWRIAAAGDQSPVVSERSSVIRRLSAVLGSIRPRRDRGVTADEVKPLMSLDPWRRKN